MALQLPSDLVADVARAAAPDKLLVATQRLRDPSRGMASAFAAELHDVAMQPSRVNLSGLRERLAGAPATESGGSPAAKGLETLLLKTMVDGVLPKKTHVFGRGVAGDSWRMFLSDALAQKLSTTNRLGLSQTLGAAMAQRARGGV